MNQEYNRLLKFVYFEGYADSYEDAEYLLEELNDDEFDALFEYFLYENVSTGNAKRASFGGIPQRVSATEADRIRDDARRSREPIPEPAKRKSKEPKGPTTVPSRGVPSDEPALRRRTLEGHMKRGSTPGTTARIRARILSTGSDPRIKYSSGKTTPKKQQNAKTIRKILKTLDTWGTPSANRELRQQRRAERSERLGLNKEEFVIDYLISEGYTDNYDSAAIIYESMSDEWMYDILEAFKDTDYKEYYKNNHIDPHDDGGERDDAEYNDYINSRRDHRDQHNARRGVKKKRGAKVRDWTNEVKEEFRDLKPEQEQKVEKRVGELARTIQLHRARVKELDQKPFAKVRPGIRSQRKEIVNSANKDANLLYKASNALIRTSVSRSAKKQKRIEDMKKRLRDMGEEP
jgi:hypothetical protein